MFRLTGVLSIVVVFYLALSAPMFSHAQETYCDYTVSARILADTDLTIARAEIAFEAGAFVNGRYFYGQIPFYMNFYPTLAAGAEADLSNTARSNKEPLYVQAEADTGSFTLLSGPTLTVANCSTDTAEEDTPGLSVGSFPALVVPRYDEAVNIPTWIIWDFDAGRGEGYAALTVSGALLEKFSVPPAQNTVIASSDDGKVRFSVLSTGEYQVNYGPDIEGKESVVIFNAAGQVTGKYDFNLYDLGQ